MRSHRRVVLLALVAALAPACQKDKPADPKAKPDAAAAEKQPDAAAVNLPPKPDAGPPAPALDPVESKDILARTEIAEEATVKHILVGWKELAPIYARNGGMDPRAVNRTQAEAAQLVDIILGKLRPAPESIDALMKEYSEDPTTNDGTTFEITPTTAMVPTFKTLALRLKLGEIGVVKSPFGYHIMIRVTPPPPDPLESVDILSRKPTSGSVQVQHVLVSWKDVPAAKQRPVDPRAAKRDKAAADTLATKVLAEVRAGGDMDAIMKKYSEDPGSKDSGAAYDVNADSMFVEPFKKLSLRLNVGEAGLVKTDFGWHIIRRKEPDALVSVDILDRKPVTDNAKVKHILLGWKDVNGGDPRAVKRTRSELETLVTQTVAALRKGEKIEPLMKTLSEDPGSAASGDAYPVAPGSGMVQPFEDMSLRLNVGETGAVLTEFGIHIIQRVE